VEKHGQPNAEPHSEVLHADIVPHCAVDAGEVAGD